MALQYLQHFLIQTADLAATAKWYVDVLGMREGPHPEFKIPTVWLYLGDTDVLHLIEGGPDQSENRMRYLGQQSGAVHG
ncbi:MAG: VOC family protein, partial [Hyphomicrobiaceae bacterium]